MLTAIVRVLPSGWGPVAVDAAARSSWPLAAAALLGLGALTVAAALGWSAVLARRTEAVNAPTHSG